MLLKHYHEMYYYNNIRYIYIKYIKYITKTLTLFGTGVITMCSFVLICGVYLST